MSESSSCAEASPAVTALHLTRRLKRSDEVVVVPRTPTGIGSAEHLGPSDGQDVEGTQEPVHPGWSLAINTKMLKIIRNGHR